MNLQLMTINIESPGVFVIFWYDFSVYDGWYICLLGVRLIEGDIIILIGVMDTDIKEWPIGVTLLTVIR